MSFYKSSGWKYCPIATISQLKYWRKDMPLLYVMSMGNGYISPAMIWKRNHSSARMGKNEKEPTHARP